MIASDATACRYAREQVGRAVWQFNEFIVHSLGRGFFRLARKF
jgi:hypothetical protein